MANPYQSPVFVSAAESDFQKGRLIAEFRPGWLKRVFWLVAGAFLLLLTIPSSIYVFIKAPPHPAVYFGICGVALMAVGGIFGCFNNIFQRIRVYETGIEFGQGFRSFYPWEQVGEVVVNNGVKVKLKNGKSHHHHQRLSWTRQKRFAEELQKLRIANRIDKYWI